MYRLLKYAAWFCVGTLKWVRYKFLDYIAWKYEGALLSKAVENLYTACKYNRLYGSPMAKQLARELVRLDRAYAKLRLGLENLYQKRDKYQLPEYVPLRDFK